MKTQALMDDMQDLLDRYFERNAGARMAPDSQAMLHEVQTCALVVIARQLQVANLLDVTHPSRDGKREFVRMDKRFWRSIMEEVGLSELG